VVGKLVLIITSVSINPPAPIHEITPYLPLLGDTTSNQALLLSAPFNSSPPAQSYFPQPTYPNYTLPSGNLSFPTPPSSSPNFTLVLAATSSVPPLTGLQQTGCRLSAVNSTGVVVNETLWLRDIQGWRNQWLVNDLSPVTNYTAYVIQDQTKVSGPIYFITKSGVWVVWLLRESGSCGQS
jgi:calcium channel MID1